MRRIGEHAVVIGASMAGLLAARSLTEAYERVTVVDRDALPAGVQGRRAVPQGRHAHALLPHGQACLDALLPGFSAELVAAGAPDLRGAGGDALRDRRPPAGPRIDGSQLDPRQPAVHRGPRAPPRPCAARGHADRSLRRSRADRRAATASGSRGVRILRRADGSAEETLAADLVVAATGRAARVPAWLEALGYPRPDEERLDVGVTYASRRLSLPADPLDGDKFVLIGARPGHPRTLFLFAQEGGRWILGLGGYGPGHRPRATPRASPRLPPPSLRPTCSRRSRPPSRLDEIATHALPCQRAPPLRPPAQLPGRAAGRRRRDLLVQPDLRAGHDGRRRPGGRAARLPRARRARPRSPLLPRRRRPDRPRLAALGRRRPGAARGRGAAARARAPRQRLSAPAARDGRARPRRRRRVQRGGRHARTPTPRAAPRDRRPRRPRAARRCPGAIVSKGCACASCASAGFARRCARPGRRTRSEAVVFLHGNPGSSADWAPLLAAAGRRWRAVAWDAPGFGRAASPAAFPQTVSAHAQFVGRALDALGIERVHLVAHDFGGPWGLAWAAGDPDRFASAVLLGTGALPGYRWHALARLWRTPHAGELLMAAATRRGFRLLLRRGNPRALPRPFVDRMYRRLRPRDPSRRARALPLHPDVAGSRRAARPGPAPARPARARALGPPRPLHPVINAERQRAAFPRAEIRVLERSGHWPFVDDPATVTAALTGFLATHAGAHPPIAALTASRHSARPRWPLTRLPLNRRDEHRPPFGFARAAGVSHRRRRGRAVPRRSRAPLREPRLRGEHSGAGGGVGGRGGVRPLVQQRASRQRDEVPVFDRRVRGRARHDRRVRRRRCRGSRHLRS